MKKKQLIVIQSRFNSARLPGKAMQPIAGLPMISYLIQRLKVLQNSCDLILSTGENSSNDVIAKCAKDEGIPVCRGPEDDVLARYILCLKLSPAKLITRVTGDNPLTDPQLIAQLLAAHSSVPYDYAHTSREIPTGMGVDVFSRKTLSLLPTKVNSFYEREHINEYIIKNRQKFIIFEPTNSFVSKNNTNISCTVDTPTEYQQVKKLIESFPKHHFIGVQDVIRKYNK